MYRVRIPFCTRKLFFISPSENNKIRDIWKIKIHPFEIVAAVQCLVGRTKLLYILDFKNKRKARYSDMV